MGFTVIELSITPPPPPRLIMWQVRMYTVKIVRLRVSKSFTSFGYVTILVWHENRGSRQLHRLDIRINHWLNPFDTEDYYHLTDLDHRDCHFHNHKYSLLLHQSSLVTGTEMDLVPKLTPTLVRRGFSWTSFFPPCSVWRSIDENFPITELGYTNCKWWGLISDSLLFMYPF